MQALTKAWVFSKTDLSRPRKTKIFLAAWAYAPPAVFSKRSSRNVSARKKMNLFNTFCKHVLGYFTASGLYIGLLAGPSVNLAGLTKANPVTVIIWVIKNSLPKAKKMTA